MRDTGRREGVWKMILVKRNVSQLNAVISLLVSAAGRMTNKIAQDIAFPVIVAIAFAHGSVRRHGTL